MANQVEGNVTVAIGLALVPVSGTDPTWAAKRDSINKSLQAAFTGIGGGANAAEQLYRTQQTIANGANFDIDMSAATTQSFGEALAFNALKVLVVSNNSTTGSVTVQSSGPATGHVAAINGAVTVGPGGFLVLALPSAAGYAVVGGTTDTIRVANASGVSVSVDILVVGNV